MDDTTVSFICDALTRIENKVDNIISGTNIRQIDCLKTFATKKGVRVSMVGCTAFFAILILIQQFHPEVLLDAIKGIKAVFG